MQPYYAKTKNKKPLYYKVIFVIIFLLSWSFIKSLFSPLISDLSTKYLTHNSIYIYYHETVAEHTDKKKLQEKIDSLSLENINLENEIANLKYKLSQSVIRDEMSQSGNIDNIIAYSLGSASHLIYNEFVVNVGRVDGVNEGSLVYTRGRQPVGRISEVHKMSATVTLLSASGGEIEGIVSHNDERVSLVGAGGGEYTGKIKNKLIDEGIVLGQTVLFAEDNTMTLGEIVNIEKQKDEDQSILHIRGYYNPSTQSIFFIDR